MAYFYSCFGLIIRSDFPIPALAKTCVSTADVLILRDKVPNNLDQPLKSRPGFEVTANEVLIRVNDSQRILIKEGKLILVDFGASQDVDGMMSAILGSALGALLQQRKNLVLHASVVTNESGSVLICGKSGQGKSTTLCELMRRGYGYASDDVSCVSMPSGGVYVNSAYPQIRLWDATLQRYEFSSDAKQLVKSEQDANKYAIQENKGFSLHRHQVLALVFLSQNPSPEPQIQRMYGKDVFCILRNNIYRKAFLRGEKLRWNINYIEQFAREVPVYQLQRPLDQNTVSQVGDIVEGLFSQSMQAINTDDVIHEEIL